MKISAGIVLIKDKKILLCHPTNASWNGRDSIPKGSLENDETNIKAAIRETSEEVGIFIPEDMIDKDKEYCIDYKDKNKKIYKKVFYYIVNVQGYPDVLPKDQLQIEEIDYAKFYTKKEAEKKIFWRFKPILNHLDL